MRLPSEEELAIRDHESQFVAALRVMPDWVLPYLAYLMRGDLPSDEVLARQIVRRSKSMVVINGELYK